LRLSRWLAPVVLAALAAGCSGSPATAGGDQVGIPLANSNSCTADTAVIRSLALKAGTGTSNPAAWSNRWSNIINSVTVLVDIPRAQRQVIEFDDSILSANRRHTIPLTDAELSTALNEIFCYVGLTSNITNPNDAWVVHVADPTATLVTADSATGIQFPPSAVVTNTVISATPVTDTSLHTLLDNYAAVYEWTLTPAQTLVPGMSATIGLCPNAAMLANIPAGDLDAVVARLVLGHQPDPKTFELLPRVPLPPQMALQCPTTPTGSLRVGFASRLLHSLAGLFLPERANATARRAAFVGGVGGSTSEFSPFGPVDPQLFASGGVGGSTTEFIRTGGALLSAATGTLDGTVGTTHRGDVADVTLTTYLGTPVPGIGVTFATGTQPAPSPAGNASVCGSANVTDSKGVAGVSCLFFGTTTQYHLAYTSLQATFTLPAALSGTDAQGNPIVTISPPTQDWTVVSHGPSALVFPQTTVVVPSPGRPAFSADTTVPTRVEIRSDLDEVVPMATNAITLTLNKNALLGGVSSMTMNAVAGVANFAPQVPAAAIGYSFSASAALGDLGLVHSVGSSPLFDVVAGAATALTGVGTTDFGTSLVSGSVVLPQPTVFVTDFFGNPKAGALVYWTPAAGAGATANGSAAQTVTATGADGKSAAIWVPVAGTNQLRASLSAGTGGVTLLFSGIGQAGGP